MWRFLFSPRVDLVAFGVLVDVDLEDLLDIDLLMDVHPVEMLRPFLLFLSLSFLLPFSYLRDLSPSVQMLLLRQCLFA